MHGGDHRDGATFSLNLNGLNIISVLGRGAKGVVFLVQTRGDGKLFALKAISRSSIEKKKQHKTTAGSSSDRGDEYRRIWFEREVLGSFNHPLLPKLHGVLVTDRIVGYAVDYCSGRDLNYLRKKQSERMFSYDIIRFYAAELVLGLEYLHGQGIVYRDLKPENVMIQENGHLMLVDFDLSTKLPSKSAQTSPIITKPEPDIKPARKKKIFCLSFNRRDPEIYPKHSVTLGANSTSSDSDSTEKSNSFVGTEEYVAPEIIRGDGHDFSVDWWCLGVMLYEMLYGCTPFRGVNRKETFYQIITKQPDLTGELTPLRDLIGKLLEKDPRKRISIGEIKGHDFFKAVDWDSIVDMPRPPFIPELTEVDGSNECHEKLDVESYVQRVFASKEEGKMENDQKPDEENQNRDVWVNNHPTQIQHDNFLVF